jgi:hypothetical protein
MMRRWRALLAALALLCSLPAAASLRVGVLTMQPGEIFFERFGHNAIVVVDPSAGTATSYNFGFFDPDEPDFYARFARGQMRYQLAALPLERDLRYYRRVGRGVDLQWLDLAPAQARALADDLARRARPENARYDYDYYTSNCSTQVRDAVDRALGGALREALSGRSRGNSYRSESLRLAAPAPWMAIGFDLGLSAYADRPLSRWDEAFVPMRLAESLREVRLADGRPLVAEELPVLPHRVGQPPAEPPRWTARALVAGLLLAGLLLWLARRAPRLAALFAAATWLLCGLAGTLMAWLWIATAHRAGHGNQNLLLLSPLCLLLLPGAIALLRGRTPGRAFRALLWIVLAGAALAAFLEFLPASGQDNAAWVVLLLPLHWALWRCYAIAPRQAATPAAG